jgi:preprotein translocase subunit YajC
MILEEAVKEWDLKNRNLIMAMSNTLKNIIAAKDGLVTNIGFLAKIKNVYENTQTIDLDNPTPAIELNKKTSLMIKDQKTDVNDLINEAIDKKELENNRVA